MDQNMSTTTFSQNVDALFTNLENFTKSDSVLGSPLSHEGKTFIPIISVAVGYGSGNSAAKNPQGSTGGASTGFMGMGMNTGMGALGLGAKVTTEAVLLIENNNVSVLPINAKNTSIVDKLPQMISTLGMGGQQQTQGQGQQQ